VQSPGGVVPLAHDLDLAPDPSMEAALTIKIMSKIKIMSRRIEAIRFCIAHGFPLR
jgi:hypothetical protein